MTHLTMIAARELQNDASRLMTQSRAAGPKAAFAGFTLLLLGLTAIAVSAYFDTRQATVFDMSAPMP